MAKKQTYVAISFGWDNVYAVPTEKVSTLLGLLDECYRISDKSIRDEDDNYQRFWFKKSKQRSGRTSLELIDELLETEPADPVKEEEAA